MTSLQCEHRMPEAWAGLGSMCTVPVSSFSPWQMYVTASPFCTAAWQVILTLDSNA